MMIVTAPILLVVVGYFTLIYLPAKYQFNKRYITYPLLKELEAYTLEIQNRISAIQTRFELGPISAEIDSIYTRYKGWVPDYSLRVALYKIRETYYHKRKTLYPKTTTE